MLLYRLCCMMYIYFKIFLRFLIILFNCVLVWFLDFNWKICVFGLLDLLLELGVDIFLFVFCFFISFIRECLFRYYIWNVYISYKCVFNLKYVKVVYREFLFIYFLIRKFVYIWYICLLLEVVLVWLLSSLLF